MNGSSILNIPDDPVFECLTAAARRDVERSSYGWVSEVDSVALLSASRSHGVDHVLLDWMRIVAPDHAALPTLQRRNQEAARFNLRALVALRAAGDVLAAAGVEYVAFKGPVLATLARSTSCRSYSDLDLMVTPQNLELALEALEEAGAALHPSYGWKHLVETEHAQVPMMLPLGVPLDLHWDLCSRPHMRRSWRVEGAEALIARSTALDTAAGPARVLDWNDMLVHAAGHAGWSGGDRLGWLVDVDSVARSIHIDWDKVINRTRAWGLDVLVGDVLRRTRERLDTPIPDAVTNALRGGSLGALFRTTERLLPMSGSRGDRSARRLLRLDVRSGPVSTIGALTRRSAAATLRRVQQRTLDPVAVVEPVRADNEQWRPRYLSFAKTESALGRNHAARQ